MAAFLSWLRSVPLPSPQCRAGWAAPDYPLNKIAARVQAVHARIPLSKPVVANPDAPASLRESVATLPDRSLYMKGIDRYMDRHGHGMVLCTVGAVSSLFVWAETFPPSSSLVGALFLFMVGRGAYHFWQFRRVSEVIEYLSEH